MPTSEDIEVLVGRALAHADRIGSIPWSTVTLHAQAIVAAIRTDPAIQDAMLAALAAGGRLVEERRQPCSCGSESVGPLRIGHLLADAHTSLRERARYVTHWREVPDA